MTSSKRLRLRWVVLAAVSVLALPVDLCPAQSSADSGPGNPPADAGAMTPEQALADALKLIEGAEEGGPDIAEAVKEATRLANYVLRQDPLNVRAEYVLGRVAILAGRPRDALARIEKYVNDPIGQSDWKAWKLLGDIYVVSYPKHAESQYKRAVALKGTEPEVLIGLAKAQLARKLADEAVENAEKAIRYDDQSKPKYRTVLAEALLAAKRYDEAINAARQAVQLSEERARNSPGEEQRLAELSERYRLLGKCLDTAVTLFPEQASYVIQLSQAIQDQADLERLMAYHYALSIIKNAVEQAGQNPALELLWEQVRLSRMTGRDTEAVEVLNRILEAEPGNTAALEALEALGVAPPAEKATDAPGSEATPAQP